METISEFRAQWEKDAEQMDDSVEKIIKKSRFGVRSKRSIWSPGDEEYLKFMMQKYGDNPECLPFLKNQYKYPYNVVSKLTSMGIYEKPGKTYCVYVIGEFEGEYDLYKIGYSNDAKKRLKSLQTGNPRTLEIVWSVSVTDQIQAVKLESDIHTKLASYNVGGEWFNVSIDEIKKALDMALQYAEAA